MTVHNIGGKSHPKDGLKEGEQVVKGREIAHLVRKKAEKIFFSVFFCPRPSLVESL
jgi:hypothetical protein